ncbi:MAG TPA: 2OG-Fe(II) oxygenase [Sphingomicrobium sp.]|nr:2OG-Fe(II) oxygenase [Sphingomicrobium sp.]
MTLDSDVNEAELARSAAAGQPEAQFAYGLALLAGERAAAEGLRGIELVEGASGQGHADAMAVCALFEAIGVARPQSWPRALDRLQLAAERGSTNAQGQLLTLAERGLGEGSVGRDSDWGELRARISIEKLLEPPARQLLSDKPRIVAFAGFATGAECNWVITKAHDRLKRATVLRSATGDQTYESVRDNSAIEFQLTHMDVVLEVLRARIASATRLPVPIFEPTQVLHYAVGEQFRPHHDFLDPGALGFAEQLRQFGQRIATVILYLNADYTGGETVFPKVGIRYRGDAGDALFFANVDRAGNPDPLTMHAGTPPSAGQKWIISQWIRDRAPHSLDASGASDQ